MPPHRPYAGNIPGDFDDGAIYPVLAKQQLLAWLI
jgi:hypothetical protein